MIYLVGVGGAPMDTYAEYDTLAAAQDACLAMARDMATRGGTDPDDIDLYDDEDCGGACPSDHDGGYWPHIVAIVG